MPAYAINHMTVPNLDALSVLGLAKGIGCVGVEFRNDLPGGLFAGSTAEEIGKAARASGLRILALAEVKAFNSDPDTLAKRALPLLESARACGAEAVALIPAVTDAPVARAAQRAALRDALDVLRPLIEDYGLLGLIEPLGFVTSSLRHKPDAVQVLDDMGRPDCFGLIHDTFHHALSGDSAFHADLTKLVHVSGVTDAEPAVTALTDAHRVLVDDADRLDNIGQLNALQAAGCAAPVSLESFAPSTHALADPATSLAGSIAFIAAQTAGVPA